MEDNSSSIDSSCSSWLAFFRNRGQLLKGMIALFPTCFISFVIYLKIISPSRFYLFFVREDGPVEWMTAISYFVASLVALSIARTFNKRKYTILYIILAIGFFLVAMEEISWGQRIFGVQSPQFFQSYNRQHEISLHNFMSGYYLHKFYIVVGISTAFGWFIVRKIRFFKGVTLKLFVPDYWLMLYFLPVFIFYFYWEYVSQIEVYFWGDYMIRGRFIDGRDQEPAELLLSLGVLIFVVTNRYRQLKTE